MHLYSKTRKTSGGRYKCNLSFAAFLSPDPMRGLSMGIWAFSPGYNPGQSPWTIPLIYT